MLIFVNSQSIEKTNSILKSLKDKRPNANFFYYDSFDLSIPIFESLIFSSGLFEEKNIIKLSRILDEEEFRDFFFKNIEEIEKSPNAFVLVEDKIDKINLDKIKKVATKTYDTEKVEKKDEFNVFSLTNYLLEKNTKKLWIGFNEATQKGIKVENIYGVFLWQLKNIILVHKDDTKNIKSFVKGKIKSNLKNWNNSEAEEKYLELLKIYHEARLGNGSLRNKFEKFILEI